jgi:hypothetical protein
MDATALVTSLRTSGVEVTADGDRLRFRPRDRVSPSLVQALARHKRKIMRILAAEAGAHERRDHPVDAETLRTPVTGTPEMKSSSHSHKYLGSYNVRPRDASQLLLGWGHANGYPAVTLSPGVSVAEGEMRWRAFVAWARTDLLVQAVARVHAASSQRCVILGCWSPRVESDPVYCGRHREQADAGVLWSAYSVPAMTQEAQACRSDASGAAHGLGGHQGPFTLRTDVLTPPVAPESRVDLVVEPVQGPVSSGLTFPSLKEWLRDGDTQMYVDPEGRLHYVGLPLAGGDPIRLALSEHLELLIEAFTYAPGRRCVVPGCLRLCGPKDRYTCPDHRSHIEALRSGVPGAGPGQHA